MTKMNRKGFTLVELLAVIVVLAIIMIVAIPSVINAMNDARKASFKVYAQKVLNQAQMKYGTDSLLGTGAGKTCYTLSDLDMKNTGNYTGRVVVTLDTNQMPTAYEVTLNDKSFTAEGLDYADLNDTTKIVPYKATAKYDCTP